MFQPSVSNPPASAHLPPYADNFLGDSLDLVTPITAGDDNSRAHGLDGPDGLDGLARRWRRERRRRKVGRAYDMALEISQSLRNVSPLRGVLDVGCGNGYIAHHLSAMLGAKVMGIDLASTAQAPIEYRPFDGTRFPVETQSLDAVLFCYVLHHAQDLAALLSEVRRVLRRGGQVVVYEDIPLNWWDMFMCGIHNRTWEGRTGPCTFQNEDGWRKVFESEGFEMVTTRPLSRWRNLAHPVSRRFFLMRLNEPNVNERQQ